MIAIATRSATAPKPSRPDRTGPSVRPDETSHSTYLRRWIAHQAGLHQELLSTIAATPKPERVRPRGH